MTSRPDLPPIAVAHVSPTFFATRSVLGGGERFVLYLARALAAGAPPGAVRQAIVACGDTDETFVEAGILVRVLRNDNPSMGPMNATSRDLAREIAAFDLVHVHQSLTLFGAFATSAAAGAGVPVVATDLGGGENELMLGGGALELARGIVSISDYAHLLVAPYAGADARTLVLRGPVDTDAFTPGLRPPPAPGAAPRVLCVGRILPHKGFDRVIEALPEGVALTIAGQVLDGAYRAHLAALASGRDVTFEHDADDARLLALYRAADVFVQASTSKDCFGRIAAKPELLGLTTLEALSCGVPVLVSDAGSLPELASDPRFARVFDRRRPLRVLLAEVRDGIWPAPGAAALARAHAVETFGLAPIGRRLARFYAAIAARAPCAS